MLSIYLLPVVIMTFPMYWPDANAQPAAVMIAQASSTNSLTDTEEVPTVGVCSEADISGLLGRPPQLYPVSAVGSYQNSVEKLSNWMVPPASATVTVLVSPKHGSLSETSRKGVFAYSSTSGYTGLDRTIFLVDIGSRRFKVVYFIQVYKEDAGEEASCENDLWRISRGDIDPNEILAGTHQLGSTTRTDAD